MANNGIKGITIEIGGDTTGLDKALKGVNAQAKNTQNELKEVNKALKLDPGNTDLLEQKQRALADAVSATAEKLDILKEAQKQAAEQLAKGEIGQEQYDALTREIVKTESALKKVKDHEPETTEETTGEAETEETPETTEETVTEAATETAEVTTEVTTEATTTEEVTTAAATEETTTAAA